MASYDKETLKKILEEHKEVHYAKLGALLGISPSTAGQWCKRFMYEYPKNVSYSEGVLRLKKAFPIEEAPKEAVIGALETVTAQRDVIAKEGGKALENHMHEIQTIAKGIALGEKTVEEFQKNGQRIIESIKEARKEWKKARAKANAIASRKKEES